MSDELTHLDARGRARMIDVAGKAVTRRECVARGRVTMAPATLARIVEGGLPKGDVLAVARIAGLQAAKRTDEWIPLAHPLPLDALEISLEADPVDSCVRIEARAIAHAKTGVEMEALVAVAAAGLALYDMCKAIDRGMTLDAVRLVRKMGGKTGRWERPGEEAATAGIDGRS
jgi:cyclic pyranopterin phosphate synthase